MDQFFSLIEDDKLTELKNNYTGLRNNWEASTDQVVAMAQKTDAESRRSVLELSTGKASDDFEVMRHQLDLLQERLEHILVEKQEAATAISRAHP